MPPARDLETLLPPLPFGETTAVVETDVRQFSERMGRIVTSLNEYAPVGDPAQFRFKSHTEIINDLRLVTSASTPLHVDVGDSRDVTLLIPFHGQCTSTVGRNTHSWQASESAMLLPACARGGSSQTRAIVALNLDPHTLQSVAARMLQQDDPSAIDLRLFDARVLNLEQFGVSFDAIFRHLCGLIDTWRHQPGMLAMLGIDDLFYRHIIMMLRPDLFLQKPAEPPAHSPAEHTLVHLCAQLEARIGEPLTLTEMERLSGLSARSLQYAFLRQFGCTPMQWLRLQRLALARKKLLAATPQDSVTTIALQCGFGNFGNFALAYAQRFGEKPSVTLRRAQQR